MTRNRSSSHSRLPQSNAVEGTALTTRPRLRPPTSSVGPALAEAATEDAFLPTPPGSAAGPGGAGFQGLPIQSAIRQILDRLGFVTPTPIQRSAIPVGIEGKDLIGIAQTGTGKTLAFGIPMAQRLVGTRGRGLVIVPTRELALQVAETLDRLGRPLRMRTAILIGGAPQGPQRAALRENPQMIVATPGRLIDHLEQGSANLADVQILVLDEADRMLDMGFAPQINRILRVTPKERQTMLFSATMPADIVEIARTHMRQPVSVEITRPGATVEEVTQELMVVMKEDKPALLTRLLYEYQGTVLVFSRTKHGAKKILRDVLRDGHTGAEIHSNRSLNQRKDALEGFRGGRYRVLVATDIASRGIDVNNIQLVVNYDVPDQPEDYVHRIGRTGRAGRTGHAITFATPDQAAEVQQIERLIQGEITLSASSEHILVRNVRSGPRSRAAMAPPGRPPARESMNRGPKRPRVPRPGGNEVNRPAGGDRRGHNSGERQGSSKGGVERPHRASGPSASPHRSGLIRDR